MLDRLGIPGVVGVLALLGGVAVIALESPVVAAGIALVVLGLALTAFGLLKSALAAMGMDGMV